MIHPLGSAITIAAVQPANPSSHNSSSGALIVFIVAAVVIVGIGIFIALRRK